MKYQATDLFRNKIKHCYVCAFFYDNTYNSIKVDLKPVKVKLHYGEYGKLDEDNISLIKRSQIIAYHGTEKIILGSKTYICSFYDNLKDCNAGYNQMKQKVKKQLEDKIISLQNIISNYIGE